MKNGYRIIDTDTHVGPNMETFHKYASLALLDRWDELLPYFMKVTEGHHLSIDPIPFKRRLNQSADPERAAGAGEQGRSRARRSAELGGSSPQPEVNNENWQGRLEDMEREGVDVQLIIPATWSTAADGARLEMPNELYAAYHRYLDDYCARRPDRLKAALMAPARSAVVGGGAPLATPTSRGWRRSRCCCPGCRSTTRSWRRSWRRWTRATSVRAPLVLLRAAVLPRVPRHLGQPGGRPHGVAPVGRPTLARLLHPERHVRPLLDPADRVRRVLRRLAAGVAQAPAGPGRLPAHDCRRSSARRSSTPSTAGSSSASSSTRAPTSPRGSSTSSATAC